MQWFGAALCTLVGTYTVILCLHVVEWMRCARLLSKLPVPKGHPVLGQLQVLASPQHHIMLAKWAAELGGIYRMRLAHINVLLSTLFSVNEHDATQRALLTLKCVAAMQAVVVTDPYLIADVLRKDAEIEKSVANVYSKFNVVRHCSLASLASSADVCSACVVQL